MNDDDIKLKSFQDDLATDDNVTDPVMDETGDDPTKELGVPVDEFKDELDKQDFGDHLNEGDDDRREDLEDREEDDKE